MSKLCVALFIQTFCTQCIHGWSEKRKKKSLLKCLDSFWKMWKVVLVTGSRHLIATSWSWFQMMSAEWDIVSYLCFIFVQQDEEETWRPYLHTQSWRRCMDIATCLLTQLRWLKSFVFSVSVVEMFTEMCWASHRKWVSDQLILIRCGMKVILSPGSAQIHFVHHGHFSPSVHGFYMSCTAQPLISMFQFL